MITKGPKATSSNSANAIKKLPPPKSKVLEEVQDMMMQSFDDPADDFSNLRKLISEVSVLLVPVLLKSYIHVLLNMTKRNLMLNYIWLKYATTVINALFETQR